MIIIMIVMMIIMNINDNFNWIFESSKKIIFFLCIYKMVNINKNTYENNDIVAMVDSIGIFWLNEKHIEEKLSHKNLPAITNKYNQKYKKCRHDME